MTERLVLHRLSADEAERLVALADEMNGHGDGGTESGTDTEAEDPADDVYPMSGDVSAERLLQCRADGTSHPGVFEIRLRADGEPIGGLDFHGPAGDDGSVTIGYGLVPSVRGRGYASEALRAVLAHAREIGIRRVKGDADLDNVASQRVMSAAGMRYVGEDERVRYYEAELTDSAAGAPVRWRDAGTDGGTGAAGAPTASMSTGGGIRCVWGSREPLSGLA